MPSIPGSPTAENEGSHKSDSPPVYGHFAFVIPSCDDEHLGFARFLTDPLQHRDDAAREAPVPSPQSPLSFGSKPRRREDDAERTMPSARLTHRSNCGTMNSGAAAACPAGTVAYCR